MNRRGFISSMLAAAAASAMPGVPVAAPDALAFAAADPRNMLLSYEQILKEAMRVLHRNLEFAIFCDNTQYDPSFSQRGDVVRVRLPSRFKA